MTEYPGKIAVVEDDPKRPYKAYASTALTLVAAFIGFWIADDGAFTAKEFGQGVLFALVSGGLIGGTTFTVRNPKRSRDLPDRGALSAGDALVVALIAFAAVVVVLWLR